MQLHNYWARLEQNLGKDLNAACGVWESLLKIWFDHIFSLPYLEDRTLLFDFSVTSFQVCCQLAACFCSGSMLEAWKGYIAMEIELGRINEARSIYKRCYTKRFPGTGSEVWLISFLLCKTFCITFVLDSLFASSSIQIGSNLHV